MDKILKVVGEGKVSLKVDTVKFNFNIVTKNKKYDEAVSANATQFSNLKNGLAKLNLNELTTNRYSVDTEYDNVKNNAGEYVRSLKGYVCVNSCAVETEFSNEVVSKIINEVLKSLSQPDFSLEFSSSKIGDGTKKAIELACKNALDTATVLAKASGVILLQPTNIECIPSHNNFASATAYSDMSLMARNASVEINPNDVVAIEKVSIEWEIIKSNK